MSILDGLNERIARHRNRDFLNAAMACSALVTQADGKITLSERYWYKELYPKVGDEMR